MEWTEKMIEYIRDRILSRVLNKLDEDAARCMLYDSLDSVFDLMTSKAAAKIAKKRRC
jgi:hypothetical protein